MSSGKVHAAAAVTVLIATSPIVVKQIERGRVDLAIGISLGALGGWIWSPDEDIDGLTLNRSRIYFYSKRLADLNILYWTPYAKLATHRGISHFPFIGTLTRILYLAPILAFLFVGIDLFFHKALSFETFLSMFIFWSIQDFIHIVFDVISTALKRNIFKRRKANVISSNRK